MALQLTLLVLGLGASFAIPVPSRRVMLAVGGHRYIQDHTNTHPTSNRFRLSLYISPPCQSSMPVSCLAGSRGTLVLLVMQAASRDVAQILPHRSWRDPACQRSTLSGSSNLGLCSSPLSWRCFDGEGRDEPWHKDWSFLGPQALLCAAVLFFSGVLCSAAGIGGGLRAMGSSR